MLGLILSAYWDHHKPQQGIVTTDDKFIFMHDVMPISCLLIRPSTNFLIFLFHHSLKACQRSPFSAVDMFCNVYGYHSQFCFLWDDENPYAPVAVFRLFDMIVISSLLGIGARNNWRKSACSKNMHNWLNKGQLNKEQLSLLPPKLFFSNVLL